MGGYHKSDGLCYPCGGWVTCLIISLPERPRLTHSVANNQTCRQACRMPASLWQACVAATTTRTHPPLTQRDGASSPERPGQSRPAHPSPDA